MHRPTLKKGAHGPFVAEAQGFLAQYVSWYKPDRSDFDHTMLIAVCEFQSRHLDHRSPPQPLQVDGVVGPLTWHALTHSREDVDAKAPEAERRRSLTAQQLLRAMPAGGSPRGRAALRVALNEMALGAREMGANNSGHWVHKYLQREDVQWSWCAAFVSWCYAAHPMGSPKGLKYSLGARDLLRQFARNGWTYQVARDKLPEPGDLVCWSRGNQGWQGHVGMVVECVDGILRVIEGNKGAYPAPVRIFEYTLGAMPRLLGFGRVPF